jgi:hypothetical protein
MADKGYGNPYPQGGYPPQQPYGYPPQGYPPQQGGYYQQGPPVQPPPVYQQQAPRRGGGGFLEGWYVDNDSVDGFPGKNCDC